MSDESLNKGVLLDNLSKIFYTVNKTYFSSLQDDYDVLSYEKTEAREFTYPGNVRALSIKRFVYNKSENSADCFQNVLSLYSGTSDALAFVFRRTDKDTEIYAIFRSAENKVNDYTMDSIKALRESFKGNFPGSHIEVVGLDGDYYTDSLEDTIWKDDIDVESIASICNIPSQKSEDYLSQGIEKVLNGIIPQKKDENYIIIILAESISSLKIDDIMSGYEEMATSIHPFISHQFQIGESKAGTVGEMYSVSDTESISTSITKTHSVNVGVNCSNPQKRIGGAAGYGYSRSKTKAEGQATTRAFGTQKSVTLGESQSTTYTYQSYEIKNLQNCLEIQAERIKKGKAIGLWRYATFVCAKNAVVSKNVANAIRSITQGESSYVEPLVIQEWSKKNENGAPTFDKIYDYLKRFAHPVFVNKEDGTPVHFSSYINTAELVNAVAFPRSSVMDLPIISCAPFGMEPHSLDDISNDIQLGHAYHMYESNKKPIYLNKKELTKHTFITGSTGSGKSNTVYFLLDSLIKEDRDKNIKFMVIEPAKGEYKDVFGNRENVHVYGTNPRVTEVLRINPFAFPEKVHVLEHIDRLTEIFNVCWPMYAAMPAILKDSIERSYISCGWDIINSVNKYGNDDKRIFPSFSDVLSEIKKVLDESDYSNDNKGDYIGSLSTRVRSLTTGINGIIFQADCLSDKDLFEENVIVDLSRIGGSETKSLIMGLLIMKMQEYRIGTDAPISNDLRHITVIEEAHNILKRTSFEQSSEGANLIGKSVEMISNSIAEMRTYGEGFIIVDQAPQLIDMSAIRNTNTKIVLRLPDYGDRELVGRSIGLNDDQLNELSRLKQGVAVVSQSGWIEPVLCEVSEFSSYDRNNKYNSPMNIKPDTSVSKILEMIMKDEVKHFSKKSIEERIEIKEMIIKSCLRGSVKAAFLECIGNSECRARQKLIYEFFNSDECLKKAKKIIDIKEWRQFMISILEPSIAEYPEKNTDAVLALILREHTLRDLSYQGWVEQFAVYLKKEKGVIG